ncbi:MAG: UvrD-helicase domain-containing protein [Anaerolineaceae bacterium]|nr:UvrD-helicase domain-containing protein [Anaerolineaceae bacterium]
MNEFLREHVLSNFRLTPKQKAAALARGSDVIVTAGAGSGKTSTLVARYVSLLADGHPLRSIVAITFTEKAAREMRSRVRQTLTELVKQVDSEAERLKWIAMSAEMESARIGTIHSMCSEILRAHPAEAGIDPKFDVIDEGNSAALQVQIVDDTMAKLVEMPEFEPLFRILEIKDLSNLLAFLLEKRLEAQEAFEKNEDSTQVIRQTIESAMQNITISDCIAELRSMGKVELKKDAGEKLTDQVLELLSLWEQAENALVVGDLVTCAGCLFQARRNAMGLRLGSKTSIVKEIVRELREAYDTVLDPVFGGKNSKDTPPDADTEAAFALSMKLIKKAFEAMVASYKEALRQRGTLDFDDLEQGAAQLLMLPEIRKQWQGEIAALLVDEFQDTNERQRQIVEALTGSPGKLFVVGDAKQSIYRFRRADVTVFRSIKQRIENQGGVAIDLDETFRAHEPVLTAMGDLLMDTMRIEDDSPPAYFVPYEPMIAHRKTAREGISAPHVEFVFGAGKKAGSARPVAARALAARLLELKQQGQIQSWEDVTLLFRASTGFPYYEDAFEDAGIPFVTVAGRGFYDRPEIRDVLNILRALADPTDDLAMAGLLRSPAFGLTDTALYQLRWQNEIPIHYWASLQGELSMLDCADQQRAQRTVSILSDLMPQVDQIPTAELLKKLVDATDYRSILAIGDNSGTGGRLWRNLDKLIEDAQASEKVNVREFLDYLETINDAGAREGEAPAEAQGSVRLMTIHKSKGLQFPIVVLADASREIRGRSSSAYLLPDLGLAYKLDPPPMLYNLAKHMDQKQVEAENQRVLYVALTRAQEKLIVSGHITPTKKGEWKASAWLRDLSASAQIDLNALVEQAGTAVFTQTPSNQPVRAWVMPQELPIVKSDKPKEILPVLETDEVPIYAPLMGSNKTIVFEDEPVGFRDWRATGRGDEIPPTVVGKMVHKAIELWLFPDSLQLKPMLESTARTAGLAQHAQIIKAVRHSEELLTRLQKHPLRKEIEEAAERHHELPYSRMAGGYAETGYIDLLYRTEADWQIIDFKTDMIQSTSHRAHLVNDYSKQLHRYAGVITEILGQSVRTRICFLDDHGRVELVTV